MVVEVNDDEDLAQCANADRGALRVGHCREDHVALVLEQAADHGLRQTPHNPGADGASNAGLTRCSHGLLVDGAGVDRTGAA